MPPDLAEMANRHHHTQIFCFRQDGVSPMFLLKLAWNCEPPDLSFQGNWDDR
jgi:hypothetical protein